MAQSQPISTTDLLSTDYFRQGVRDDVLDLSRITPEQVTKAAKTRQIRALRKRYSDIPYDPYEPSEKAKWREAVFERVRQDTEKESSGRVSFHSMKARFEA
jgi:hypothetical protein